MKQNSPYYSSGSKGCFFTLKLFFLTMKFIFTMKLIFFEKNFIVVYGFVIPTIL